MKLDIEIRDDVTVMKIVGELNADAETRFDNAIEESMQASRRDFVVDLSEVTSVDSAGLELLTALQRRCDEELGMVRLCGLDDDLQKIAEMTRLNGQFSIYPTVEDAQASLTKV